MSLESCLFKCYNNPRDVCKTSARHRSSLLYLTENCFYHPDLDRQLVKRCISHEWEKISFEELEQQVHMEFNETPIIISGLLRFVSQFY